MKKFFKYLIFATIVGLILYNSISIGRLSALKAATPKQMDVIAYTKELWVKRIPGKLDSAVALPMLIQAISNNKEIALAKYTNALGIGNYRYALVKTEAIVTKVEEDEVRVQINMGDSVLNAIIATEYIYGNAIRDASGLVSVNDFSNTSDLNSISETMNAIVRKEILTEFKKNIQKGNKVKLVAAIELNKEFIKWNEIELLPVHLEILH